MNENTISVCVNGFNACMRGGTVSVFFTGGSLAGQAQWAECDRNRPRFGWLMRYEDWAEIVDRIAAKLGEES